MYMLTTFYTVIPPSCIGALIPFMAADLNIDETEYSTMFIFISLGCLASAILFKLLTSKQLLPKHHTTMIICALEVAIFSLAMLFSTTKTIQIIIITILCAFGYFQ
jgi:predicted MFS family arabinose efflux permease